MSSTMTKASLIAVSVLLYAGSACASDPDSQAPNDGKAAVVTRTAGEVAGAVLGGLAGEATAGPKGALAGGVIGEKAGGALFEQAGRVIDQHAVENQRSGRGGPDDPRYDPTTLFNH